MKLIKYNQPHNLELWGESDEKYFEIRQSGKVLEQIKDRKAEAIRRFNKRMES